MKKLIFALTILTLAGAGCADQASNAPAANEPSEKSSVNENANVSSESMMMETLPPIEDAEKAKIDDSAWTKFVTKSGVEFTYPEKGSYAPTWEYLILKEDDPHLSGNCYVTEETKYERTDVGNLPDSCQTTTETGPGPGTRIDYVVFGGDRVNLFAITKQYPENFDMDAYSATVDRIIGLIK